MAAMEARLIEQRDTILKMEQVRTTYTTIIIMIITTTAPNCSLDAAYGMDLESKAKT